MSAKSRTEDLIESIKNKGKTVEAEMSFFDHLDVLRKHLIRASIAIVVFTGLAFTFYDDIFNGLIMGPKEADFWSYRMLCKLGDYLNRASLCVKVIPFKVINTELAGQFTLQMNSSFMIGIVCGVPYLLYEIWLFVKPGLTEIERKSASGFVFYATMLFLVGILFGYYVIVPVSINFLSGYTVSNEIVNMITIDSYLSTVATLTLGAGIVFQLPIIVFILSKMGIMTPKFMRSSRRYAIVLILIIAAVVTPTPDILTMGVVAFPLFILYELSISVSASVERRRKKKELEFYNS